MSKLPREKWFFSHSQKTYKSIFELKEGLKSLIKDNYFEDYEFHTKKGRNDYATWIKDIFNEEELAKKIESASSTQKIVDILEEYLNKHQEVNKKEELISDEEIKKGDSINQANQESLRNQVEHFAKTSEESLEKVKTLKKNIGAKRIVMTEQFDKIKEEYEELYTQISDARKEGINVLIPSIKLRLIKPKIDYFEVSRSKEDYNKIIKMFEDAKKELQEAKQFVEIDIKKEILQAAEINQDTKIKGEGDT